MTIKHDHLYDIGLVIVGLALFCVLLLLLYALCKYYDRKIPTIDSVAQGVLPRRVQSYYFFGEAQKLQDDFIAPQRDLIPTEDPKLYETKVEELTQIPMSKSIQNLLEVHCEECEAFLEEEKARKLREEYGDELSINEETGEKTTCSRATVV